MDKPLGVNEVRTAFRRITGDGLQLHPFPTELEGVIPRVDYLSFDTIESAPDGTQQLVSAPEKLRETYGDFEIAVYESSTRPQAHEASPDERGIRWLRLLREVGPRPGKYLVAEKSYGSNIVLKWYPEGDRKETTPQWDRLRTAGVRSCSATSLHAHRSSAAASSVRRRPLIVE